MLPSPSLVQRSLTCLPYECVGRSHLGQEDLQYKHGPSSLGQGQPADLFTLALIYTCMRQERRWLTCAARAVSTAERAPRDKPEAEEVLRDAVLWPDFAKPF